MDLSRTLTRSAEASGDRVAVRAGEQSVTYRALDARVDAAAWVLQQAGVEAGDRVAVVLGTRITFVVAYHAALRIGAVAVPIGTTQTAPEVAHQLTDCRARAIVVGRAYTSTIESLRGTLPALEAVFVADSTQRDPGPGMTSWAAAVQDAEGRRPDPVEVGADDLALLAYTSGTTGAPKGAMLTHGQLLANQRQLQASGGGVDADDVVLCPLPLFHIYALNVAMGPTLSQGATLELVERFEPTTTLDLIAARGVTVVVGAPPMYVAWLNTPGADQIDLSSVRLATSGAAALPPRVLRRCREELDLDVREGYGLVEPAPDGTTSAALPEAVPGSVGVPLDGVEVRIAEGASGLDEVEPGEPGRVLVRGENVFSGYWEHPDATAEALVDGWLETGDVGYLDGDRLVLVDRLKDLIIVSGFNVYPVEVEAALMSHPAVDAAAVIGVPHPYTGEAVKAFVVATPGSEVTADELIAHTGTQVARFKRPESIEFVEELPTLPTGKVRRRLLRSA